MNRKMKLRIITVFLGLLLWLCSRIEGFSLSNLGTTNQYQYLAPPGPITIPSDVIDNLLATLKDNTTQTGYKFGGVTKEILNNILASPNNMWSVDEINYFISNKKWPYNSYITDTLTKNPSYLNVFSASFTGGTPTIDNLQKILPSRTVYSMAIYPIDKKTTPPPQALSVYNGTADTGSATGTAPGPDGTCHCQNS